MYAIRETKVVIANEIEINPALWYLVDSSVYITIGKLIFSNKIENKRYLSAWSISYWMDKNDNGTENDVIIHFEFAIISEIESLFLHFTIVEVTNAKNKHSS